MSQIVTATDDADESDLQEIEAIPEVQSILDELNYNKIPRNISVTTTEVGPETSDASITNVEFNLGMLQVATAGEAVFATFRFDENKDSESKKKRESDDEVQKSASQHSYRKHRNLPSDSEAWLHGTETDAKLYRTATSEEYKDALSQAPVEDTDNIMVYTHEDINGFYVEAPPQKPTLKATNTNEKLSTSYLVPAGDVSVESVTTQIISSPAKKRLEQ